MNNIRNEFNEQGLAFDRTVDDLFELPFSYNQIEIQPNELAVASTINLKLQKIYYNLLYLYSLCNIANYNIPNTYTGWIGVTGSDRSPSNSFFVKRFSNTFPLSTAVSFASAGSLYSGINNSKNAICFNSKLYDSPVLLTADTNTLTLFVFDYDYTVFSRKGSTVLKQSAIDPLSGSLTFNNITGLAFDEKEELLFVVDQNLNNVYAYDITNTISLDILRSRKIFLSDFIGGKGTAYDNTKFDTPNKIAYDGEMLYVEDTGNKCIKVYNKTLDWVNTTILKTLFNQTGSFNALAYYKLKNQLYACSDKSLYVLDITSNFNILSSTTYDYSNIILGNDRIVDIKFAHYDPRILYILTEKSLIKKWTTKLNSTIGIYPNSQLQDNKFKWLANTSLLSADSLLLFNTTSNSLSCNIALFEDNLEPITLLKDSDFNIYTKEDIFVNKNEYNQAWVYNKAFKKILYNTMLLTSNIGYRFFEGRTATGLYTYVKKMYNTFFLTDSAVDINTFTNVCVNENFQASAVNRSLKKIYDYHYQILTSIVNQENINNNLLPRSFRGNNRMFDFTLYYQGTGITIKPNGFKMYSNTDGFVSVGDVTIVSLAPYTSGGGIIII